MRATLAQLDPTVGDLDGNAAHLLAAVERAEHDGAELLVAPELATIGYPPRDLLLREGIAERCRAIVERIAAACSRVTALIGFPERLPEGRRPFRNAVAVCRRGRVEAIYAKRLLPTYDVFDEDRYFESGDAPLIVEVGRERVGVLVCEDLWRSADAAVESGGSVRRFREDPLVDVLLRGATTLAILSASPFVRGKDERHRERLSEIGRRGVPVIAVNQVGANDDLVFDGRSRAIGSDGATIARLAAFGTEVRTVDLRSSVPVVDEGEDPHAELCDALVAGIRGYFAKTGHASALLGLSGGIDSALVAALAVAALGPERVVGVLMPSRYSSGHSVEDALDSAARLAIATRTVPIEPAHDALERSLRSALGAEASRFDGLPAENLQSRIRGTILMGLANAANALVLTTGNKSELAVGYATLYGDLNGGLAPIGDLPKTTVAVLARWLNEHHRRYGFARPPIPPRSIEKPPSAELRPDQTDQDSLPPYEVLDAIVEERIERERSVAAIARLRGLDETLVARWCRTIDRMQYKRDQAAVILKVSPRAFGRGRPMPIAGRSGDAG
jgi:NAD+ synthetase